MSTQVVHIYHNPRCSKSRQTLALLQERGLSPEVVLYLERGVTESEVRTLARALGQRPHALLRTKEEAYAVAGLSDTSSDDEVIAALVAHPILLERPIVVSDKGTAIGRPPENVLSIL